MVLLHFPTFPFPIHFPQCWTKYTLKTSAIYQSYNSHTILQNRFRRNFKWKSHFYTQPSCLYGYNLARNGSCEYLSVISSLTIVTSWRGEKSGSGVSGSVVFKWQPPPFPVPDTGSLRLRPAPSPFLYLHWQPKLSHPACWCKDYFSQHWSQKSNYLFNIFLAFTPTPLLFLSVVTISDASVHHIVWANCYEFYQY